VWCWAIIVNEAIQLNKARRIVARIERDLKKNSYLPQRKEICTIQSPQYSKLETTSGWEGRPVDGEFNSRAETRERIEAVIHAALTGELRRVQKRLPFLATASSFAPSTRLFSTKWGSMNSFTPIARSHDTNLTVVAPGIAEALFATAIGLVAAIPAVMAYNKFATEFSNYSSRVQAIIGAYGAPLSRASPEGN
jgi:biopolymer transport protein TolQ